MDSAQYLAFIPLLIYGLGLSTLLSEWKRIFDPRAIYIPYSLLTLMLTETAVYNIFIYIRIIKELPDQDYIHYLIFLTPPFLFYLATHVFTPDKDSETKEYLIRQMPLFMSLLALFIGSHFIYGLDESKNAFLFRLLFIALTLLIGFLKRPGLIYLLFIIWIITFIFRGNIMAA